MAETSWLMSCACEAIQSFRRALAVGESGSGGPGRSGGVMAWVSCAICGG